MTWAWLPPAWVVALLTPAGTPVAVAIDDTPS